MKNLNRLYSAFEDYLSGGLLFLGLTLVFINVILRYFFGKPQSILDEFSIYLVVWGTMAGMSVALRNDHHIKVDMLFDCLPKKIQQYITLFAHTVGIAFCVFFVFYGSELVQTYIVSGQRSSDSQFPLWIVNLIMPVSGLMMGIRFVEKFVYAIKDLNIQKKVTQVDFENARYRKGEPARGNNLTN